MLDVEDLPGHIVDTKGNVLGQHKGTWNYTIGQRKGLGIAFSEPLYVIGLNAEENTVIVGIREETYNTSFIVEDLGSGRSAAALQPLSSTMWNRCRRR